MNKQQVLASLTSYSYLIEQNWINNILAVLKDAGTEELESRADIDVEDSYLSVQDGVGVLTVTGPIFPEPNIITRWLGMGTALSTLSKDLIQASQDPEINSIVMRFNTPGGAITGVDEMSALIKNVTATKPVIGYVDGLCASAGYWIASACSELNIGKTGMCGSIGVITSIYAPKDEEDFYVEITSTQSPNKRVDPRTDEGKELYRQNLDAICDVFVETVADNRGVSKSTVLKDFGKGWVLVGQDAVDVSMVDKIGSFTTPRTSSKVNIFGKIEPTTLKEEKVMDLKTLKAEHKDLYNSIMEEGAKASVEAQKVIDAQKAQIAELEAGIKLSDEATKATEVRLLALEKASALAEAKQIKTNAGAIFTEKLNASNIPESLHSKVQKQVDYNAFILDGVFDAKAFGESIDAEIRDWEGTLASEDKIQGFGTFVKEPTSEIDEAVTSAVDRMSKYFSNATMN